MPLESKLKFARSYLGKTQNEIAKILGISKRGWQTYEDGSSVPGGNIFKALADLGFNAAWFFSDDVPMLLKDIHSANEQEIPAKSTPASTLGENVELLAKIHNSGSTVLIKAITANLHAFTEAIDNKALAQQAIDMMDQMNKRMLAMETDLAELKEENKNLREKPPDIKQQANG